MKKTIALVLTLLVVWSCTDNSPSGPDPDDFEREKILINWADNIIIPAFTAFSETTEDLHTKASAFTDNPTQQQLDELREAWLEAYLAFQHVSMFEMGTVMNYRDFLNTYPTNANEDSFNSEERKTIEENIETGEYNFELPSSRSTQGFPALDYLLYGLGENDDEILTHYTTNTNAENYRAYLIELTNRIDDLTNQGLENWTTGYRDEFVSNTGNGANASLDMMVNDYILHYENRLRTGKIGIPAGISPLTSATPSKIHVEAYYSQGFSKPLFNEALTASINFFNGTHFGSDDEGQSLNDYLDYLNTMKNGADLAEIINNQFEKARNEAEALDNDFASQVESDNVLMLSTYEELQKNVVNLKVDMLQALNINVDYVDTDGD